MNINPFKSNTNDLVDKALKENAEVSTKACVCIKESNGTIPRAVKKKPLKVSKK